MRRVEGRRKKERSSEEEGGGKSRVTAGGDGWRLGRDGGPLRGQAAAREVHPRADTIDRTTAGAAEPVTPGLNSGRRRQL